MASSAVGITRVSRVVGYQLNSANFAETSPNLPQRIVVLGQANTDKQVGLDVTQNEINNSYDVGVKYGFGSQLHMASRILHPANAAGVGGIPVVYIAQVEPGAGVAKEMEITVTGTATANVRHNIVVAGRESLDGESYAIDIVAGDTPLQIATKFGDAMSNVTGCPFTVDSVVENQFGASASVTITSKFKGLTSADLNISVNNNDNAGGVSYAFAQTAAASGASDIAPALATWNDQWNTLVLNTYNLSETDVLDALEAFNGVPDNTTPTGQFQAVIQRPFIAVTGSVDDENTTWTDTKKSQVTNAIAPAPLSDAMPLEAAANMIALYAPIAQNTPHLDVNARVYPDMPFPDSIGTMSVYNNRDAYVKKGNSTVTLTADGYKVQDFVTTYHPDSELVPQHRYVRNRTVDSNIRYTYHLSEEVVVIDKVIVNDDDPTNVNGVVKPKEWKAEVFEIIDDLQRRALIADSAFSKSSLVVNLSMVNPDRFETFMQYKRSGIARILSTTVEAGFNFGTL